MHIFRFQPDQGKELYSSIRITTPIFWDIEHTILPFDIFSFCRYSIVHYKNYTNRKTYRILLRFQATAQKIAFDH